MDDRVSDTKLAVAANAAGGHLARRRTRTARASRWTSSPSMALDELSTALAQANGDPGGYTSDIHAALPRIKSKARRRDADDRHQMDPSGVLGAADRPRPLKRRNYAAAAGRPRRRRSGGK